jgi:putative redox protein
MAIKQKTIIDMNVSGKVVHHARTDIAVRDLTVIIDEPVDRGGTNLGATPTETVAVALAGCLTVVAYRIAIRLEVDLQDMKINVAAKFDRRGVMQQEQVLVPFPEIDVNIDVKSSSDDDKIEQLKSDLVKFCPVSNMIRQSGSILNENWNVTKI